MAIDEVPFREPGSEETTTIYRYDNNKRMDFVTKKYKSSEHIKIYERISGKQMVNVITGEIKDFKHRESKTYSQVVRKLKATNRLLIDNFSGDDSEMIIVLGSGGEIIDIRIENRQTKNFCEKLQRRLPPIIFVKVLLYRVKNIPEYHLWIKTVDGSKLEIDETTIKALWEDGTRTARIEKITKENRYSKADYFTNKQYNKNVYPTSVQICTFSRGKGINLGIAETVDRDTATEQAKGFTRTFAVCKSQTEYINGVEQETQLTTYESYIREPKKIKLNKTKNAKYKGSKINNGGFFNGKY